MADTKEVDEVLIEIDTKSGEVRSTSHSRKCACAFCDKAGECEQDYMLECLVPCG